MLVVSMEFLAEVCLYFVFCSYNMLSTLAPVLLDLSSVSGNSMISKNPVWI